MSILNVKRIKVNKKDKQKNITILNFLNLESNFLQLYQ
jgi:hypothetical protein